jgi:SAM-dependent methyltransferase
MTLTLDDVAFLSSPAGQSHLAELAESDLSEGRTLALLTGLRHHVTPAHAGALLTTARLRQRAADKFPHEAAHMLFTDDALQQASDPLVRRYRAQSTDAMRVLDVGCGIGADTLAFADAGTAVLGVDIDPVRLAMARHNAAALGYANARFILADATRMPVDWRQFDMAFYDPARRDETGRRLFDVEGYIPPLSTIGTWPVGQIAVKVSPGVNVSQLAGYGGAVEFISVRGDLKEALLWIGQVRPAATLLVNDARYHWHDDGPVEVDVTAPRGWLVEPDPALIRAGLVQHGAATVDGTLLDATIAYFTTDSMPDSPWLRSWRIRDWLPFNLKKLRAYLREHNVGSVTVKKRGTAVTPEALTRQLKLNGTASATLVLTRHAGVQIVLICDDLLT